MVINEVRRYGDDTYKYCVGNVDSTDDDDWSGLYEEDQLTSTGVRVDVSHWDIPGPFDYRDVVVVSASVENSDLCGQTGVVESWHEAHEDLPETLGVWFPGIARFDVVNPPISSRSDKGLLDRLQASPGLVRGSPPTARSRVRRTT